MTKNANDYQYWSKTADRFDAATEYIAGVKTLEAAKHWLSDQLIATDVARSEERRVGKECRSRWSPYH